MKEGAGSLTDRQRAVLSAMEHYRREMGLVCTVGYLAHRLSIHHSTVQEHLQEIYRKGFLRAPVPGALVKTIPWLPPLPIPERDDEDGPAATVEERTVVSPSLAEPVRVQLRTLPGQTRPSTVIVRTRTRTRRMEVLRDGGPDGPITGFEVVEEVEG